MLLEFSLHNIVQYHQFSKQMWEIHKIWEKCSVKCHTRISVAPSKTEKKLKKGVYVFRRFNIAPIKMKISPFTIWCQIVEGLAIRIATITINISVHSIWPHDLNIYQLQWLLLSLEKLLIQMQLKWELLYCGILRRKKTHWII